MQKQTLINGSHKIEYCISGLNNLETIFFVHGLGANCSQFEKQHDFFSKKYKVLSFNLRGHGNSSFNNLLNLHSFTEDILVLLNKLEISKIHFVGNSLGGNVGYELLKTNPEVFNSFITFGTTAELHKSIFTFKILQTFYHFVSIETIAELSKISGQTKYAKNKILEMYSQTKKEILLKTFPFLASFNYLETIKQCIVPVLIIKGEKDYEINKELSSTISCFEKKDNFTLETILNAGHFTNLDNPEVFNKKVFDFISQHTI